MGVTDAWSPVSRMSRVALDQTRAGARTARSVPPALDPNEDDGPMTHLGVDTTQEQRCEASGLYCPWRRRGLDQQFTVVKRTR